MRGPSPDTGAGRSAGIFAISVAAEMVSMAVQNLRVYERRGLLTPARTPGGTRLYSQDDLERLVRIRDLLAEGLNLAGVGRVLSLEARVRHLEEANTRLRRQVQGPQVEGRQGRRTGGAADVYAAGEAGTPRS